MNRALVFLLSVLPACAAPTALAPLDLRDPFAVSYRGGAIAAEFAPQTAEPTAEPTAGPQVAQSGERATVHLRAVLIELDVTDARSLLASLPQPAATAATSAAALPGQGQPTEAAWPLAGIRGAHMDPALVDVTVDALRERANVLMAPQLVVSLGEPATIAVEEQRAVVRSLDFLASDDAVIANPRVGRIDYGDTLAIRATPGDPGTQLSVNWSTTRLVTPVAVAATPLGSLHTPVLLRHELTASPAIAAQDALVLASIPGAEQGRTCLLMVAVEIHPQTQPR